MKKTLHTPISTLILWVTTDCNLCCRYCYARGGEAPEAMDWQVARRVLDLLKEQGFPFTLQFAGGEPLLQLDLVERIVRYTQGSSVRYQLQTNATLVNAKVAQRLRSLGIAVGVSLDSIPRVKNSLRPYKEGKDSTAATLSGLASLREAGVKVGLTTVLSSENVAELPQLVELASYMGNIEGISLDLVRPVGRGRESVLPASPEPAERGVRAALETAEKIAELGGRRIRFREVERMLRVLRGEASRTARCRFASGELLVVTPKGEAFPCPSLTEFPEFSLGTLEDAAFLDGFAERREYTKSLLRPSFACQECPRRDLCQGPCPVQGYLQNLAGRHASMECAVRRVFMEWAFAQAGAARNQSKKREPFWIAI